MKGASKNEERRRCLCLIGLLGFHRFIVSLHKIQQRNFYRLTKGDQLSHVNAIMTLFTLRYKRLRTPKSFGDFAL